MDERMQKLVAALAEYFDHEPGDVTEFVLGVEFRNGEKVNFQTTRWGIPWHFNGMLDQIKDDIATDKRA